MRMCAPNEESPNRGLTGVNDRPMIEPGSGNSADLPAGRVQFLGEGWAFRAPLFLPAPRDNGTDGAKR